jgi:multiple sugar transport system substrate-binding protein
MVALSLSNRLTSRRFQGEQRDIQEISFTRGRSRLGCSTPRRPRWPNRRPSPVWFGKGFYKSEDDALLEAIKKFEAKTGIKVELSQYAIQDMIPKTVAALDSGTVPDVAYSDSYDVQAQGKWAFEGKLEDLSDIMTPMKSAFAPNTLETVSLYNDVAKKRAYYGFPLKQQSMHVQIWGDMLEQAGLQAERHPDQVGRLLVVLVRQGAACGTQGHRPARLRRRPADGRGIHR